MESDFITMWQEAEIEDASIGGVDSIPEWEYSDYVEAFLMNVRTSIRGHFEAD